MAYDPTVSVEEKLDYIGKAADTTTDALATGGDAGIAQQLTALAAAVATLQTSVTAVQTDVAALQTKIG